MTRIRACLGLVALAAALCATPLGAAGQEAEFRYESFGPAVRILRNFTLGPNDSARQVVVIGGDARIEGHVTEDVVVVLGKVELGRTAVVDGTFVAVAGAVDVAEGAKVNGDFVTVGDANVPGGFSPGGGHVVIGLAGMGENLRSIVPWVTHGLVLGRPIVPWLGWIWIVAAGFFFINLCLNVLFDTPVRACTTTMRTSPLSCFMAGLLVLLLAGPLCLLLAVSVIGIAVIPFVFCAIVVAALLGRVAFARWIGMTLVRQDDPSDRQASMRSFLIGSAVMCVAYMVPFIGFMVWSLAGVFGLGAATLAFHSAYRRENPKPPKRVKTDETAAPPSVPMDTPGLQPGDSVALSAVAIDTNLPPAGAEAAPAAEPRPESRSHVPSSDVLTFPKAVFVERLAALALDAIAISIIAQLLSLDRHGDPGERLMVFLALIYHVGFWTWRGTTPGGMICQLRVIKTDGKPLEFPESLVRGLTGIISLAVVGLGFLWILRDPERQGWHDRVAGTYVIKVPRAYAA